MRKVESVDDTSVYAMPIRRTRGQLSGDLQGRIRCPACTAQVVWEGQQVKCVGVSCGACYPVVNGVPVLIDDERSVFSKSAFLSGTPTYFAELLRHRLLRRLLPDMGFNIRSKRNYQRMADALTAANSEPIVLIVGAGHGGSGLEGLTSGVGVKLVNTDVTLGPGIDVICDGHDLPFLAETFDGVVAQAVLEHVLDPYRCVDEIHRVLKPGGIVYAETPFMQQVHGGRYDYTRFTYLGHRRLFRKFEEIAAGAAGGPATVVAWSYEYFLASFARGKFLRRGLRVFARLTAFWLKYLDLYLIRRPATLDAAWGYFFLGRKSSSVLSDRELLRLYWRE